MSTADSTAHVPDFELTDECPPYVGVCSCGWCGDATVSPAKALSDANWHATMVEDERPSLVELEAQAKARTPWPKTPSMTRAHFDYLARIIASLWPDDETSNTEHVAEHFAYHLADTNPRFNRERFVEAATR